MGFVRVRRMPLPLKLLVANFAWILPYLLVANYLERSLLPFRLMCYTEADLLSIQQPVRQPIQDCVRHFFPNRKPADNCVFRNPIGAVIEPNLPADFEQVVVVRSAPGSLDYRMYIRDTWKTTFDTRRVPVIFVCGYDRDRRDHIQEEAALHDDILQLDFVDSYQNLTLKMMATYNYFLRRQSMKQLIVINDDTMVNRTAIFADAQATRDVEKYMIGKVSRGYPRLFMPWLLWHIPSSTYKHKCYPPFVQGSSFILSRAAAAELLEHVCDFPFVPLDDVMTGIIAHCVGTKLLHREGFDKHTEDSFSVYHYQYSRHSAEHLRLLWNGIKRHL